LKIKANQLSSHLKNNLASCYLVTGDEHLLVDEALDAIRAAAREKGFTSRDLHVAMTGFDWQQLRDSASNLSLFAERRIIEIRLPTGKPGRAGGQAIVDLVGQLDANLMLIVSGPKLDGRVQSSKWVKTLEAEGVNIPTWPIDARELPGWLAKRMRRVADQEIEKLRLLLGEGKVTADDVSSAVANSSRYDVFKLVDAALVGDAKRSLKILAGLRAEGIEPVIVVWSLTRELRVLANLADAITQGMDLASGMRKARIWNNRQSLVRSCVARHQPGDFHRLLKATNYADRAAKGQTFADPWQVATEIVLGLSLGRRKAA
jgi:DNA polymerase-3 subunit delta